MIVLTAIAAFFKKIWDWIRQTAWVQPLLIVGIIFGIIFSIPSIVNAIKDAQKKSDAIENYYHNVQLSLEGAEESDAYKDTDLIYQSMLTGQEDAEAIKAAFGTDKFFLVYVEDTCSYCAEAKGGFDVLETEWNTSDSKASFYVEDGRDFKLWSIFIDEYTSETTSTQSAFAQYMNKFEHYFELAAEAAENTDYYINQGSNSEYASDINMLADADASNLKAPIIMLIDYSEGAIQKGVSEVMFGVAADTDYKRAELLLDCWNHAGDFTIE